MTDIIVEDMDVYMVWTKHGRAPNFCHATVEKAEAEAGRLANKHPGWKYIVMRTVNKRHVPVVPVVPQRWTIVMDGPGRFVLADVESDEAATVYETAAAAEAALADLIKCWAA